MTPPTIPPQKLKLVVLYGMFQHFVLQMMSRHGQCSTATGASEMVQFLQAEFSKDKVKSLTSHNSVSFSCTKSNTVKLG
jgi:hypothetical protein